MEDITEIYLIFQSKNQRGVIKSDNLEVKLFDLQMRAELSLINLRYTFSDSKKEINIPIDHLINPDNHFQTDQSENQFLIFQNNLLYILKDEQKLSQVQDNNILFACLTDEFIAILFESHIEIKVIKQNRVLTIIPIKDRVICIHFLNNDIQIFSEIGRQTYLNIYTIIFRKDISSQLVKQSLSNLSISACKSTQIFTKFFDNDVYIMIHNGVDYGQLTKIQHDQSQNYITFKLILKTSQQIIGLTDDYEICQAKSHKYQDSIFPDELIKSIQQQDNISILVNNKLSQISLIDSKDDKIYDDQNDFIQMVQNLIDEIEIDKIINRKIVWYAHNMQIDMASALLPMIRTEQGLQTAEIIFTKMLLLDDFKEAFNKTKSKLKLAENRQKSIKYSTFKEKLK